VLVLGVARQGGGSSLIRVEISALGVFCDAIGLWVFWTQRVSLDVHYFQCCFYDVVEGWYPFSYMHILDGHFIYVGIV
jgi:hypothetical protein